MTQCPRSRVVTLSARSNTFAFGQVVSPSIPLSMAPKNPRAKAASQAGPEVVVFDHHAQDDARRRGAQRRVALEISLNLADDVDERTHVLNQKKIDAMCKDPEKGMQIAARIVFCTKMEN